MPITLSPPRGDRRWLAQALRDADHLPAAEAAELATALRDCSLVEAWERAAAAAQMRPAALAALLAPRVGLPLAPPALLEAAPLPWPSAVPPRLLHGRLVRLLAQSEAGWLVATADAQDTELPALLQFAIEHTVQLCLAPPDALAAAGDESVFGMPRAAAGAGGWLDTDADDRAEPAIVRLSHQLFREAVARNASDVHIQPQGSGGLVRLRIDGVLRRAAQLPERVRRRLISRLKLLAEMDPTDSLHPQDGRLRLRVRGRWLDVRLSSVPVDGGEKLVARLLGAQPMRSLREVGLQQPELDQFAALLGRRIGLLLVSGPTGSGKTTTLYAALAERNDPAVNIASVEEPVEIRLAGVAQIEVNAKAGITFATALRSVLRQDPDIVLVGEIRDAETAQIAVQAALTGHLVLATLHANDAAGVLPRLLDLGISPQLLGQTLAGSCSQRLLRRLCEHCAEAAPPDESRPEQAWLMRHAAVAALRHARGCEHCGHTGYRGRLPINQVLSFSPAMAELLEQGAPMPRLRQQAAQGGMRSLARAALDRLQAGDTSLDEVLRELGTGFWGELAEDLQVPAFQPAHAVRSGEAEASRGAVLVVASRTSTRALAADLFGRAGWSVLEAADFPHGRLLLAQAGAVNAMLLDFAGIHPESLRDLLDLRASLAGVALPIFGLLPPTDDPQREALEAQLSAETDIALRPQPATEAELQALIEQALQHLGEQALSRAD